MNDSTKTNDITKTDENGTFTIPMKVLDGTTGELKEIIDLSFTREDIREARENMNLITVPHYSLGVIG